MRISELIGSEVHDADGEPVGRVYDVRVTMKRRGRRPSFEIAGLVVGPHGPRARAAHAWGYAEGRAEGPWLLRALTAAAVRDSYFVPAGLVRAWRAGLLEIEAWRDELEPLRERV